MGVANKKHVDTNDEKKPKKKANHEEQTVNDDLKNQQHSAQLRRAYKAVEELSNNDQNEVVNHNQLFRQCIICFADITANQRLWFCWGRCWLIIHSSCASRWTKRNKGVFRCPQCFEAPQASLKLNFMRCWCRNKKVAKNKEPLRVVEFINSCGSFHKKPDCDHICNISCHPGECPPCEASTVWKCSHGTTKIFKCAENRNNNFSKRDSICTKPCGNIFQCGNQCTVRCHRSIRSAKNKKCPREVVGRGCLNEIRISCAICQTTHETKNCADFAGHEDQKDICASGIYFDKHIYCPCQNFCSGDECERKCINNRCDHHEHSESPLCLCARHPKQLFVDCKCGRNYKASEELNRTRCSDPLWSCGGVCGKILECGHPCQKICHEGNCPPCTRSSSTPCRCGEASFEVLCVSTNSTIGPKCDRLCTQKSSCFHAKKCNTVCCPLLNTEHPPCNARCLKTLPCGHTCDSDICHTKCPPCGVSNSEPTYCPCGETIVEPAGPCRRTFDDSRFMFGNDTNRCSVRCSKIKPACGHRCDAVCCRNCNQHPCEKMEQRKCQECGSVIGWAKCSELFETKTSVCQNRCPKILCTKNHQCQKKCGHSDPCLDGSSAKHTCDTIVLSCGHPCRNPCFECDGTGCLCLFQQKVSCDCGSRVSLKWCQGDLKNLRLACDESTCESVRFARRNTQLCHSIKTLCDEKLRHSIEEEASLISAGLKKIEYNEESNNEWSLRHILFAIAHYGEVQKWENFMKSNVVSGNVTSGAPLFSYDLPRAILEPFTEIALQISYKMGFSLYINKTTLRGIKSIIECQIEPLTDTPIFDFDYSHSSLSSISFSFALAVLINEEQNNSNKSLLCGINELYYNERKKEVDVVYIKLSNLNKDSLTENRCAKLLLISELYRIISANSSERPNLLIRTASIEDMMRCFDNPYVLERTSGKNGIHEKIDDEDCDSLSFERSDLGLLGYSSLSRMLSVFQVRKQQHLGCMTGGQGTGVIPIKSVRSFLSNFEQMPKKEKINWDKMWLPFDQMINKQCMNDMDGFQMDGTVEACNKLFQSSLKKNVASDSDWVIVTECQKSFDWTETDAVYEIKKLIDDVLTQNVSYIGSDFMVVPT